MRLHLSRWKTDNLYMTALLIISLALIAVAGLSLRFGVDSRRMSDYPDL